MPELPGGPVNPADHADMADFTPVPPGKYIGKIMTSEIKNTTTGGQMLVLKGEIAAGPYAGKLFMTRLNLWNQNPTAVKIANEELSTIARACGLTQVANSEQLHGIAMVVTLNLIPRDGQYKPKNECTFYSSAQGLTAPPVNPEPDEATLAIINDTAPAATTPAPGAAAAPPPPPAGAAAPGAAPPPPPAAPPAPEAAPPAAPPAAAAPATEAPAAAPAAPPAPAAPAAPAPAPAAGGDKPPW